MRVRTLHRWQVTYEEAIAIQQRLRREVREEPLARPVRIVAGADVAYSRRPHQLYAAVVLVELPSFRLIARSTATRRARFPYIPGLFTFREAPPLLAAFRRLDRRPDVILFDGHGRAHPRRFGLACHAGLLLDTPSVGCAKSRLVGEHGPLGLERGATAALQDEGELVGAVVRTRTGVASVFVSVGHRITLADAVEVVLATTGRFRVPEPLRLAHQATRALMAIGDRRAREPTSRTYPDMLKARL